MSRLSTLFIVLFSCLGVLSAQNPTLDSLKGLLDTELGDSTRMHTLIELSRHLYVSDMDATMNYLEEAKDLAEKTGNDLELARIYDQMGRTYGLRGAHALSLESLLKSNELFLQTGNSRAIAYSNNSLGTVYSNLDDLPLAIEYFQKAETMFVAMNDTFGVAMAKLNIGAIHNQADSFHLALDYYFESLELAQGEGGRVERVRAYANNNIGHCYMSLGEVEKGLEYFELSYQQKEAMHDVAGMANTANNLSEANLKLKRILQAKKYAEKARLLADSSNAMMVKLDNLRKWSDIYSAEGNYRKAWETERRYTDLRDSVKGIDLNEKIAGLQVAYNSERQMSKIKLLNQENELLKVNQEKQDVEVSRQYILLFSFGAGILVLALVVFLLWGNNRLRRRNNETLIKKNLEVEEHRKEILAQNEELHHLNQEKDNLMSIVAHDLKSPLSKAKGLAKIVELSGPVNAEQKEILAMMDKVFASGENLIEELVLVNSVANMNTEVPVDSIPLNPIVTERVESFKGQANTKSIHLEWKEISEEVKIKAHPGYFERVLDNLISNALKFSPKGSRVLLKANENGSVVAIDIIDQGPGIPREELPDLFKKFAKLSPRPTASESSTGLGLFITRELLGRMNGRIEVESQEGEGTRFRVIVPKA